MKIYDSLNLPVLASAVGAVVTLTAIPQGNVTADKLVSGSPTFTISNPTLEFSGHRYTGMTSTVTLLAVANTNTLTIGGKTYVAGTDFVVGGNDSATASNLAAAINHPVFEAQGAWVSGTRDIVADAKVSGTGVVSSNVDLETSQDGVNWVTLGSAGNPLFQTTGTTSDLKSATVASKGLIRVKPSTLVGTGARLEVWASAK